MPQIYNGSQSLLEDYAINGNPIYPGGGRLAIIQQSKIGLTKYTFQGPYKNPVITGNPNDSYSLTHTNAISDETSPYNGKGTNDEVSAGVFNAIFNYNGGSIEDRLGSPTQFGSGRNPQITLNAGTWGYGPEAVAGTNYIAPDMSLNVGQVII